MNRVTLSELEHLMSLPEGEHLEFKEAKNTFEFDLLVKYCVALANEGSGTMTGLAPFLQSRNRKSAPPATTGRFAESGIPNRTSRKYNLYYR